MDFVTFGDWVRRQRLRLDLTQAALARRVSCAPSTIKKIEHDERHTSRTMAEKLAEGLEIPDDERELFVLFGMGEISTPRLLQLSRLKNRVATTESFDIDTQFDGKPKTGSLSLVLRWENQPRHNLPHQPTSFIGRKSDLQQVRTLLGNYSLVTLTGSGGVGKSRLGLQVASDCVADYPDGVWLVELAALTQPDLIPQTVVRILGLLVEGSQPSQEALEKYLRPRQMLLVLDNCEHLVETCARFAASLLQHCPGVKLLATSRERLGIAGEVIYSVPSLAYPKDHELISWDELSESEYDAVRFFVERAREVLPSFEITRNNAPFIIEICQRLDGIPLALELAAARLNVLNTAQLSERFVDAFNILTGGRRDALPQHQTLSAAIDWSYQLLDEQERMLFGRLSIFVGTFSLQGAEQVCAGDGLEDWEIFDLLTSLVDKSIVIPDRKQGKETRYHLLEIVRQFAREKLVEAVEAEKIRIYHLEYYAALAEKAYLHLHGAGRLEWTERMKPEYANIRAALVWSFQDARYAHLGLSIAANMADRIWQVAGYQLEDDWLDAGMKSALQAAGDTIPKLLQARVYYALVRLGPEDEHEQQAVYDKCVTLCHEVGPEAYPELCLAMGIATTFSLDEKTLPRLEEAIRIARGIGPSGRWALSQVLWRKALYLAAYPQHAFDDEAYAAALESTQLSQSGDRWECQGLRIMGIIETRRGQMDQALQHLQKTLDLSIEVDAKVGVSVTLFCLILHYRKAGKMDLALRCCQDKYPLAEIMPFHAEFFFYPFGMVLVHYRGDSHPEDDDEAREDGLRLIALWDKIKRDSSWYGFDHEDYVQALKQLRGKLGATAFNAIWAEGQAMTQDEGMVYTRVLLEKYVSQENQA